VTPVIMELGGDVSAAAEQIGRMLVSRGEIPEGSMIVLVSVARDLETQASNFIKLQRV